MISEQEFLARVSQRLGRKSLSEAQRPEWAPSLPLPELGLRDADALAARFQAELERLTGRVHRVASEAEVGPTAVRILEEAGVKGTVVRWEDPTLAGFGLDEALAAAGHRVVPFLPGEDGSALVKTAEQAVAGVTGCDAAIAETGTLVLASSPLGESGAPGRGRVVSLLPPIHLVVLRKEQIVYSTVSIFRRMAAGPMPSQLIFASGPSRSSDIENDLSIGVHGPGQVHVILL